MGVLGQHRSDAVRYWAASARLGADTAFEEGQMKIGRRLAIKLLNASKFALSFAGGATISLDPVAVTVPLDRAMLAGLAGVVDRATAPLTYHHHTRPPEATAPFSWTIVDDASPARTAPPTARPSQARPGAGTAGRPRPPGGCAGRSPTSAGRSCAGSGSRGRTWSASRMTPP